MSSSSEQFKSALLKGSGNLSLEIDLLFTFPINFLAPTFVPACKYIFSGSMRKCLPSLCVVS